MGCGGSAGMRTLSADAKSKVEELFDKMDKDTSGTITKEEAHKFFSSFAKVNAKAMFDEVDDDGNGSITKAEWVGFWNQACSQALQSSGLQIASL
ncbi:Xpo1 [Symbiodinium sp. CCMP2456]|nr:Xpo1 [Symbiodinium sp. CCMP2456]